MTLEILSDWIKVIDTNLLCNTTANISINSSICPDVHNVFKAFQLCSLKNCKVVMLGQDPYPQKGVATGILFGNKQGTKLLSPSLTVIKDAAINQTILHNYPIDFDITLELWCKQGVLMLNSALTVETNKVGSHTMIWRPFIADFLKRLSAYDTGLIFVLFGEQAKTFKPYIKAKYILEEKHPAYYARVGKDMNPELFYKINNLVKLQYGESIEWYKDYE